MVMLQTSTEIAKIKTTTLIDFCGVVVLPLSVAVWFRRRARAHFRYLTRSDDTTTNATCTTVRRRHRGQASAGFRQKRTTNNDRCDSQVDLFVFCLLPFAVENAFKTRRLFHF